jgi:hypothetical protein
VKYIKYNKVLVNPSKRDESTRMILEFFKQIQREIKEMKGFIVMDNIDNSSESIVLTFWQSKEDMDRFYYSDNRFLSDLVEKLKPSFEQMPERKDYQILNFEFFK